MTMSSCVVAKGSALPLFRITLGGLAFLGAVGTTQAQEGSGGDIVPDDVMSQKAHGTCPQAVQGDLRWGCDAELADGICCFNRDYAEPSGSWRSTTFLSEETGDDGEVTFHDSVTGKVLFRAPRGRSFEEFVAESTAHGWPSFRDQEVEWDAVRVLEGGETVSADGTHLGHNIPDPDGNRYCINLVSIAGNPAEIDAPSRS